MIKYDHLLGREFFWEKQDCYDLLRAFYEDNFQIELPNFARPENFWDHGMSLYMEHYHEAGFRPIDVHPTDWQVGDVFLMAILSHIPNHVAILVEDGHIIHHLYGTRSRKELYSGNWRDKTVGVFRHKDVVLEVSHTTQDLMSILPEGVRRKINALREAQGISD